MQVFLDDPNAEVFSELTIELENLTRWDPRGDIMLHMKDDVGDRRRGLIMDGFVGKVAVVTGAGSGIGQALAVELARSGAKLAISDFDVDGLARTDELIQEIGAPVRSDRLDVTERAAFLAYADTVHEHFGVVNQIYNIAGIAFLGDIEVSEFKDIERVMDVDYWGVVNGTKAFLPHLVASGDGHKPARTRWPRLKPRSTRSPHAGATRIRRRCAACSTTATR